MASNAEIEQIMYGISKKMAERKAKREKAKESARKNPVIAVLSGTGTLEQMILRKQSIIYTREGEKPLNGISAWVEYGRDIESRVTLTRIALLGAAALAVPKKKGGERFLTIEGEDFFWCMEVSSKNAVRAAKFAAKVNQQAKEA